MAEVLSMSSRIQFMIGAAAGMLLSVFCISKGMQHPPASPLPHPATAQQFPG